MYAGGYDAYTIVYNLTAAATALGCTSTHCAQTAVSTAAGSSAGPYGSWLVASSLDPQHGTPAVPLPASFWFMLSGVGALGFLSRRRGH